MVEYVNVVICKHQSSPKQYVFRAPDSSSKKLDVGDWVMCDTCYGKNQVAQCVTPQFEIADFQLNEFYGVKVDDLKPVTAYLKPIVFAVPHKE